MQLGCDRSTIAVNDNAGRLDGSGGPPWGKGKQMVQGWFVGWKAISNYIDVSTKTAKTYYKKVQNAGVADTHREACVQSR